MKNPALFVLATLLACPVGKGAIIATAGFEDNTIGAIAGQGGGSGWTNNWSTSVGAEIVNASLSYSNGPVVSNGGSQAVNVVTGTAITDAVLERKFATQNGDVYMSFLWRDSVNDTAPATGDDFAQIGFDPATDNGNPNLSFLRQANNLGLRTGTSGRSDSGVNSAVGTTFMIVLKATSTGGNYNADLWVNPSSLTEVASDVSANNAGIANIGTFLGRVAVHWQEHRAPTAEADAETPAEETEEEKKD